MTNSQDDLLEALRRHLSLAHGEALKVHDSPLRADRLADQLQQLRGSLDAQKIGDDRAARIGGHLDDALRVLRRDDDGREAAKHLQTAMRTLEARPKHQSPFLDD